MKRDGFYLELINSTAIAARLADFATDQVGQGAGRSNPSDDARLRKHQFGNVATANAFVELNVLGNVLPWNGGAKLGSQFFCPD